MRNMLKAPLFAAIATSAMVAGLTAPAQAARVRVVHQGQSIQAAVNASHYGDTVFVDGGVYRQTVVVTKSGISLIARGAVIEPPNGVAHTPCAEMPGGGAAGAASPGNDVGICLVGQFNRNGVVTRWLSNVTVAGFTVRNFSQAGIWMLGGKNVVVRHNTAINDGAYGIARFVSTGGRVDYNSASGNDEAGLYWGDSPHSNALIQGNTAYGNGDWGIFVRDSSHGTVQDNVTWGNCAGIMVLRTGSAPVTGWSVQHNVSHDNNRHCPPSDEGPPVSGIGIVVAGADHVRVQFNSINHNVPSGPTLASGGVVVISTTSFGGANESNISVYRNTITNNRPTDTVWDHQGTNVRFIGNICTHGSC